MSNGKRTSIVSFLMLFILAFSSSLFAMEIIKEGEVLGGAGSAGSSGIVLDDGDPAQNQELLKQLDLTPDGKTIKNALMAKLYYDILANVLIRKIGETRFQIGQNIEEGVDVLLGPIVEIFLAMVMPDSYQFRGSTFEHLARAKDELPHEVLGEIQRHFEEKVLYFIKCLKQSALTPIIRRQMAELVACEDHELFVQKWFALPEVQKLPAAQKDAARRDFASPEGSTTVAMMKQGFLALLEEHVEIRAADAVAIEDYARFVPGDLSEATVRGKLTCIFFHMVSLLLKTVHDVLNLHYLIDAHRREYLALIDLLHHHAPAYEREPVFEAEIDRIFARLTIR